MNKLKFIDLGLSVHILRAIEDMGFEEASVIQSETIPHLMEGKDLIGQAPTGTGKTAAFAIPIIENLEADNQNIQAIVLCPTRELVVQVADEFRKLTKYAEGIAIVPVYGGQEIDRQFRALSKKPQIIIGTPGRTIDHIKRGSIKLGNIKFLILDEADEMLDMGFRDDIELILAETPKNRQTIMFSATMPFEIVKLMKTHQNNPIKIDVTSQKVTTPKIEQIYFEIQEKSKPEALARLLDLHSVKLALVFCNTRNGVDNLVDNLKTRGYFAEGLHGDMSQKIRDKVMASFRNGSTEILVATDVAGRGIDVNDIECVFNYDLPGDDEDYLHRIGRTGRAGKSGIAYSFVTGKQIYALKRIERAHNIKIIRHQVPTMDDLESTRFKTIADNVAKVINEGHLTKFVNLIEEVLLEDYTALDIAAALLKSTIDEQNTGFDGNQKFEDTFSYDRNDRGDSRRRGRNDRGDRNDRYDRNRGGGGGRDDRNRDSGGDRGRSRDFDRDRDRNRDFGNDRNRDFDRDRDRSSGFGSDRNRDFDRDRDRNRDFGSDRNRDFDRDRDRNRDFGSDRNKESDGSRGKAKEFDRSAVSRVKAPQKRNKVENVAFGLAHKEKKQQTATKRNKE